MEDLNLGKKIIIVCECGIKGKKIGSVQNCLLIIVHNLFIYAYIWSKLCFKCFCVFIQNLAIIGSFRTGMSSPCFLTEIAQIVQESHLTCIVGVIHCALRSITYTVFYFSFCSACYSKSSSIRATFKFLFIIHITWVNLKFTYYFFMMPTLPFVYV